MVHFIFPLSSHPSLRSSAASSSTLLQVLFYLSSISSRTSATATFPPTHGHSASHQTRRSRTSRRVQASPHHCYTHQPCHHHWTAPITSELPAAASHSIQLSFYYYCCCCLLSPRTVVATTLPLVPALATAVRPIYIFNAVCYFSSL